MRRRNPTVADYRNDPLYPRIVRAVADLLRRSRVVAPVDLLIAMDLLSREHLEDWRRGRVPYLERVIRCNLTRLGRLLRILRLHAHDLNLKPSWTAYMRWGKGPKQRLRFTKTGDPKVEEAYATHYVWPGKEPREEVAGYDRVMEKALRAKDRVEARRAWPVRKVRLGEEPSEDLSFSTTPGERLAMMWQLACDAWAMAGLPIPDYPRNRMPIVKRRLHEPPLDGPQP